MNNWTKTIFALGFIGGLAGCASKNVQQKSDPWLQNHLEKSKSIEMTLSIIQEMAIRRTPDFVPILIEYSNYPDDAIRRASLEALIAYGPYFDSPQRDEVYLARLSDNQSGIRDLSAQAIQSRLNTQSNTTYLLNTLLQDGLQSSDWKKQRLIIECLQWQNHSDINPLLLQLALTASHPQVRKSAVTAMGLRKMAEQKQVLFQIQNNDLDADVRQAASVALTQIGGKVHDTIAAVMPFEIQGTDPNQLALGFQNYLSGALSSAKVATIVERGQVDKVMDELVYQDSFIDDNKAIEIGKSLRASQVITGNIQFYEHHVTITVKKIDVTSQEILASAQVQGLILDFDALQKQVAEQFIAQF